MVIILLSQNQVKTGIYWLSLKTYIRLSDIRTKSLYIIYSVFYEYFVFFLVGYDVSLLFVLENLPGDSEKGTNMLHRA